jgi:hypothetical protein
MHPNVKHENQNTHRTDAHAYTTHLGAYALQHLHQARLDLVDLVDLNRFERDVVESLLKETSVCKHVIHVQVNWFQAPT